MGKMGQGAGQMGQQLDQMEMITPEEIARVEGSHTGAALRALG